MQARTDETQARLVLRTKEERLRAVAGKGAALENQAHAVAARIAQEERQATRRLELADHAARISGTSRLALSRTQELLTAVTSERQDAEAERSAQDTSLHTARKILQDLQTEQRTLDDLAHRRELALAQLRSKYEQLAAKAIDDLGLPAQTLIDEYGPHLLIEVDIQTNTVQPLSATAEDQAQTENSETPSGVKQIPFVRAEQEKRLARAERDLSRLGKINPLALEEHAALEERQRYLTEQLQDLRKSREDLLKIVRDIDKRVNEVMQAAFVDVSREFTGTFTRLFPGGEGKLILTDPDSPLTTGIEIEARPPGKRVKRLSLLSGGERSLTAIAFLVSIFKARPSPFYVMDEVEAALDDVNLSRLIEIFKELQDNSQLLVITHQKRTMEIADALYGVAMKEQGVTSVISQRLQELVDQK
ncbi:AAA family ATPase [Arcanobacterium hippocoleae]